MKIYWRINGMWDGEQLVLELDHVDGNRANNSLNNLRILCPNCHSQTPTFRAKNRRKNTKQYYCDICGKECSYRSSKCRKCNYGLSRVIDWPAASLLEKQIMSGKTYVSIANELGVTDNAVRGFFRRELGYCPKPPAKFRQISAINKKCSS